IFNRWPHDRGDNYLDARRISMYSISSLLRMIIVLIFRRITKNEFIDGLFSIGQLLPSAILLD
ncbi:hypothetical protein, partial [Sulfuritalea sp.]|uniref:hypothetical protein n=1 Tax=Sulfuritalea sp. TaxID=2480090 RepID=UPI00286DF450